jgi:hypothetical protein
MASNFHASAIVTYVAHCMSRDVQDIDTTITQIITSIKISDLHGKFSFNDIAVFEV